MASMHNHYVHLLRHLQGELANIYCDIKCETTSTDEVASEIKELIQKIDNMNPMYDFEEENEPINCK